MTGVDWRPIPGLFACGEMVGGLFHGNYPGGSGLVSGAVFGKIAGESAAAAFSKRLTDAAACRAMKRSQKKNVRGRTASGKLEGMIPWQ